MIFSSGTAFSMIVLIPLLHSLVVDVRAAVTGEEVHLDENGRADIRFTRPRNETVTELLFRGILHVDGIPLCE